MKNKIIRLSVVFFFFIVAACAHKETPAKIGDEHIRVPPVTKARSAVIPIHGTLPDAPPAEPSKTIDPKKCTCIQMWLPVCGENGKTYSNSCFAECAGVKYKPGSCKKDITD